MTFTRVYPNGEKRTFQSEKELLTQYKSREDWQHYNRVYRPGCALFAGNKCVYEGTGFSKEHIKEIEDSL